MENFQTIESPKQKFLIPNRFPPKLILDKSQRNFVDALHDFSCSCKLGFTDNSGETKDNLYSSKEHFKEKMTIISFLSLNESFSKIQCKYLKKF